VTTESIGTRSPRSPAIAALLSFLWPGLGQWYVGRPRAAAVFALPIAALFLLLVLWLAGGADRALIDLLVPAVAAVFIVAILAEGGLRIGSMIHAAWLVGGRAALRRRSVGSALGVLGLVVVVTHVWAIAVAWSLFQAPGRMFVEEPVAVVPQASGAPTPSDDFLATPAATPESPSARINILLTGIDSSETRNHALTDTLMVISVDPTTGKVAMVSFPRDIARFTMSNGQLFTGKINALMTTANNNPGQYPDGGLPTLIKELGFLLGVPIHYYAAVDLEGFARLIDAVGGVTINNPRAIDDPSYGGWTDGRVGFHLSAGVHHLDGETALAYARSRKGSGDNDFTRARRQQQIILALRSRFTDPSVLVQLPSIIDAGSRTLRTNFPQDRLKEMLDISKNIENDDEIRRIVLGPPYAVNPPPGTPGGYQLILDMNRLAKLSIELFGTDSSYSASSRLPAATPVP
jgi:LCP family protein required for cell wall assembly